jgi:hypothetical protein
LLGRKRALQAPYPDPRGAQIEIRAARVAGQGRGQAVGSGREGRGGLTSRAACRPARAAASSRSNSDSVGLVARPFMGVDRPGMGQTLYISTVGPAPRHPAILDGFAG